MKENNKITADKIVYAATKFHDQLKREDHGRYRSWEYCYTHFSDARKADKPDYDYLSLHLAFYLASWGMYRGSSFLLRCDYKVHQPVVKEILKTKYDVLAGIECKQYYCNENLQLLMELVEWIRDYYEPIWKEIKKPEREKVSDTLITKILMGTMACVPAYDRYFVAGVRNRGITSGGFTPESILGFADFYQENEKKFEKIRANMRVGRRKYPQMKFIDMGFWKIGSDLDKKNKA